MAKRYAIYSDSQGFEGDFINAESAIDEAKLIHGLMEEHVLVVDTYSGHTVTWESA